MSNAGFRDDIQLRALTLSDAAECRALTQAVGWPHRVEDWQLAIGLGRGVVAIRGSAPVASAMWWPYGETHAALGMIIVLPGLQGAGLGRRLMQALLTEADGRSLLLNATAAGEPLYARHGFVPFAEVTQYQGAARSAAAPSLDPGVVIRAGARDDLKRLAALDLQATGLMREALLASLLERGDCTVLEHGGCASGFSILRASGRGMVIGPVIAPDEAGARLLIAHGLHGREGAFVRIDLPGEAGLGDWLAACGLQPAGTVKSMVRGERPARPGPARLYGLVSQALG